MPAGAEEGCCGAEGGGVVGAGVGLEGEVCEAVAGGVAEDEEGGVVGGWGEEVGVDLVS